MRRFIILALIFIIFSGQIARQEKYFKAFMMNGGTFDTAVGVVITSDTLKALELIRYTQQNPNITIEDFKVRGICFVNEGYPTIMWLNNIPRNIEETSILNHELLHLTADILKWAGVPLNDSSEEVYAYMLQYLTKQFYMSL